MRIIKSFSESEVLEVEKIIYIMDHGFDYLSKKSSKMLVLFFVVGECEEG